MGKLGSLFIGLGLLGVIGCGGDPKHVRIDNYPQKTVDVGNTVLYLNGPHSSGCFFSYGGLNGESGIFSLNGKPNIPIDLDTLRQTREFQDDLYVFDLITKNKIVIRYVGYDKHE